MYIVLIVTVVAETRSVAPFGARCMAFIAGNLQMSANELEVSEAVVECGLIEHGDIAVPTDMIRVTR